MTRPTVGSLVEQLRNEYARHGKRLGAPELWVMAAYRFGHWARQVPGVRGKLLGKLYTPMYFGVLFTTGCTINREAELGEGFHLIHIGNIKIHPGTKVGKNVGVMHDVTIGTNMDQGAPEIGDNVFIGAGAKILGAVRIGDGAWIAANSLVMNDVPAGATAIGVPARNVRYTGRDRSAPVGGSPPAGSGSAGPARPHSVA